MLFNGLFIDDDNLIQLGRDGDVCDICLLNRASQDSISLFEARDLLRGKLSGKPIFKKMIHGHDYVLCGDHLKKMSDLVNRYNAAKAEDAFVEEIIDDAKEGESVPVVEEDITEPPKKKRGRPRA